MLKHPPSQGQTLRSDRSMVEGRRLGGGGSGSKAGVCPRFGHRNRRPNPVRHGPAPCPAKCGEQCGNIGQIDRTSTEKRAKWRRECTRMRTVSDRSNWPARKTWSQINCLSNHMLRASCAIKGGLLPFGIGLRCWQAKMLSLSAPT